MAKMTLEELRKLRDSTRQDMSRRETEGKEIQIIVGMGTCGIAAGAKAAFDAIVASLEEHKMLTNVVVRHTGCMGLCYVEPTVEVIMPGMPSVIYGKVDANVGRDIVRKHVMNKKLLENHIYDRPAADITKK